jgi:hypothetical protein
MDFDFAKVAKSREAARRERAQYVYCLLVRVKLWLLARLQGPASAAGPCCEPA